MKTAKLMRLLEPSLKKSSFSRALGDGPSRGLLLACLVLIGCGGSGGGSSSSAIPNGGYVGTWQRQGESGTASLVIARDGQASGFFYSQTQGIGGPITGVVKDGHATLDVDMPQGSDITMFGDATLSSGELSITSEYVLVLDRQ